MGMLMDIIMTVTYPRFHPVSISKILSEDDGGDLFKR